MLSSSDACQIYGPCLIMLRPHSRRMHITGSAWHSGLCDFPHCSQLSYTISYTILVYDVPSHISKMFEFSLYNSVPLTTGRASPRSPHLPPLPENIQHAYTKRWPELRPCCAIPPLTFQVLEEGCSHWDDGLQLRPGQGLPCWDKKVHAVRGAGRARGETC